MIRPLVILTATLAISYAATSDVAPGSRQPDLLVVQDVPADVQAELDVTWNRFLDRFGSRWSCIGDVSVALVRDVEGGDARYVIVNAVIEIQIPTTPTRFRESFAHELAHHVEHTCSDFAQLKAVLHPRFGGPNHAWSNRAVWEESPSELWAESVVQLVNGERILHAREMPIDVSVVEIVEAWARRDALVPIR